MHRHGDGKESVPSLLNKLCSSYAKHDPAITASFLKLSLNFLSNSSVFISSNVDELSVAEKIRRKLSTEAHATEKLNSFELLYEKLKKGNILENRCAILAFLLNLGSVNSQSQPWLLLQELKPKNLNSNNYVKCKESKETVTRIYSGRSFESNSQITSPSAYLSETQIKSSSNSGANISESELIKDIVFSFQGIDGKILRKEPSTGGFVIDSRLSLSRSQKAIVQRLAELGFLHNQIKNHCDSDKQIGVIGQSLVAALRDELTVYYQHIAILQSSIESDGLTLRRLLCWVSEPQFRLQWLANLALECQDKKGGALISTVYSFLQHGAPLVQTIVRRILKDLCTPLLRMLTRWLLDGYIDDPCGEFFIEARPVHKEERLWHDKYHVRSSMLPVFISDDQAKKILVTGKSINFIREVCQDLSNMPSRNVMQRTLENIDPEALFTTELSVELHNIIDSAYHDTSDKVLNIMRGQNRLIEHMQAFRRYLLLGQGDFIRHLLELLAPELSKPATEIYPHTLSSILDSAVRVTNAQFENPDTLQRLDVRLMEVSQGDVGWDVFTLLYHIDGPIGTVFEPTLDAYRTLFGALWKSKRMEYSLSCMWKRQIISARIFRRIKEVSPVMQNMRIITSEMVHFIRQTQYYFLFEVLECSWADMLNRVNLAESLDDVIKAHNIFLQSVQRGVLVDPSSQELYTHLCTIYNTILKLETIEENLYKHTEEEFLAIKKYEAKIQECSEKEGFGITGEEERQNIERVAKYNAYLQSTKTQIRSVAKQYNDYVRKYLQMLASHSDMNLQLLCVRMDFDSYYERGEPIANIRENNIIRREHSVK